jgi:hypothetical protein
MSFWRDLQLLADTAINTPKTFGRKSGQTVKLVFSRRPQRESWICTATNETRWVAACVLS